MKPGRLPLLGCRPLSHYLIGVGASLSSRSRSPTNVTSANIQMQNSSPSRQEAAREILRRRKLRTSFTDWCRECGYEPARHHRLLIEKLEALERGDIHRLLVTMPPGSA